MSKDTGGFAFPFLERGGGGLELTETGMTLRDYFAAKAMQGLVAQAGGTVYTSDYGLGATWAYRMADAMLEARK